MNSSFKLKKPSRSSSSSTSPTRSRKSSSSSLSSKSRSSSKNSKSNKNNKELIKSYSDSFSSGSDDEEKKILDSPKKNKKESKKKEDNLSDLSAEFSSSSRESFKSDTSNLSRANSLKNLEEEYQPKKFNLPLNVRQAFFSIKESMVNIYMLKKEYQKNLDKMKSPDNDENELKSENEKLTDLMIKESVGCISLNQVIYGSKHYKTALAHANLALIYLDYNNLPKQAKHHCEEAWTILIEEFKEKASYELNFNENYNDVYIHENPDLNKHQMILNYIYGRSCTILKENEEGETALEKAQDFFESWQEELKERKVKSKYKDELRFWQQKIYLALAKQTAINKTYGKALEYYDKCIDLINKLNAKSNAKPSLSSDSLLIEIYHDKAKIQLNKENFVDAVKLVKDSLDIAGLSESQILVQECKLTLANIYSGLDDMNSFSKAEDLFKDIVDSYSKMFKSINEKPIKAKDEFVKLYIKQEKFDDAINLLNSLIKDKIEFYGDFNLKLNTTYKLLCSCYLKKADMPNAAKFLQKSLELEELNYGKTDKRTVATKETLESLKKNPSVQTKLKTSTSEAELRVFKPANKIDYSKTDKLLYSNPAHEQLNSNSTTTTNSKANLNESSQTANDDDEEITNKINPLK